jgi:hypothetical protein
VLPKGLNTQRVRPKHPGSQKVFLLAEHVIHLHRMLLVPEPSHQAARGLNAPDEWRGANDHIVNPAIPGYFTKPLANVLSRKPRLFQPLRGQWRVVRPRCMGCPVGQRVIQPLAVSHKKDPGLAILAVLQRAAHVASPTQPPTIDRERGTTYL